MRMLKVAIATGAWIFWPAFAAAVVVALRKLLDAVERRTMTAQRVRFIGITHEPDEPRVIHVTTAHGVVVLRPTAQPVVHSDGSERR